MNELEIITEIKKLKQRTQTLVWTRPPNIDVKYGTTLWNFCLHYSTDKLRDIFNVDIFHSWKLDSLEEGIAILRTIFLEDGYENSELENLISKNIEDLQLKDRNELFLCAFVVNTAKLQYASTVGYEN